MAASFGAMADFGAKAEESHVPGSWLARPLASQGIDFYSVTAFQVDAHLQIFCPSQFEPARSYSLIIRCLCVLAAPRHNYLLALCGTGTDLRMGFDRIGGVTAVANCQVVVCMFEVLFWANLLEVSALGLHQKHR